MAGADLVEGKATLPVLLLYAQADQALRSEIEMYIQSDRAVREARAEDFAAQLVSHQVFDDVCEMVDGLVQMGHQTLQGAPPSVCFLVRMVFSKLLVPVQRQGAKTNWVAVELIDDEAPQDTDFAVLGGGMAGLQVAVSLSRSLKGSGQNVTVVEPREAYKDDRTFCFWNVSETPSTPAIAHRWSKWRVQANGRSHTASSDRYEYVCIPGEAFYQHAIKELDASEEVTLVTSTTAHRVQASTDNQTLVS